MIILRNKLFHTVESLTKFGGLTENLAKAVKRGSTDPTRQQYLKDIGQAAKKRITEAASMKRLPGETGPQFKKRLGVHRYVGQGAEGLKARAEKLRLDRKFGYA